MVTAAPLPTGYTRFYLQRRPPGAPGTPDPVSFSQLIPPVGTTYTFTVTTDEGGRTLFTFDLTAARTRPFARPGHKPELGDRVVTTTFQVATCENGGAVANPATDTALVADCDALLAMRDALAGTATLNWAAGTPISSWEGVTVAGTPQRVTKLSLANSSLTGELPRGLGGLTALTELRLNGNQLTGHVPWALTQLPSLTHLLPGRQHRADGCVPPALRSVTNNDLATWPCPTARRWLLTLTAERAQCTEATLNPVTWTIARRHAPLHRHRGWGDGGRGRHQPERDLRDAARARARGDAADGGPGHDPGHRDRRHRRARDGQRRLHDRGAPAGAKRARLLRAAHGRLALVGPCGGGRSRALVRRLPLPPVPAATGGLPDNHLDGSSRRIGLSRTGRSSTC